MKRALAAAALCVAAGCSALGAIQAYPGSSRSSAEIAIVQTSASDEHFTILDNRITAVDGVRYEKGGYEARMLPGAHRIGVQSTLRVGLQTAGGGPPPRVQYCAFDLDVQAGCAYRPTIPGYPRTQIGEKPDTEWRMNRAMTVLAQCTDTSYALQVPIDCSSRP